MPNPLRCAGIPHLCVGRHPNMVLADIHPIVALMSTAFVLMCGVTLVVILVGLGLAMRRSTRQRGQRVLFLSLFLIAFDLGLLLLALTVEARVDEHTAGMFLCAQPGCSSECAGCVLVPGRAALAARH